VIAQRTSRRGESYVYLKCAQLFYWLFQRISEVRIPPNTGDFRLLDARVVREIRSFRERHGFLRGLTATVGFSTAVIPFDRDSRFRGKTQIPFMGAVNIALDGIIPFSRTPLRVMFVLGLLYVLLAKGAGIAWLVYSIVAGFSSNWPIIVLCLLIVGATGLIVACMGILGEYLVRAYEEARSRPLYIVDEIIESKALNSGPSCRGNESVDRTDR
jgi:glycosyltransferase involved in cell wall biosynthesis